MIRRSHLSTHLKVHFLNAGRPIVTESWITASGVSGVWVDPEPHLLSDPAAEKKHRFHMPTSFRRAQQGLLLANATLLLTPGAPLAPLPRLPPYLLSFNCLPSR
jgi:hypothetical protein